MTEQIDGIKMQTCKDKGVLEDIPGRLLFCANRRCAMCSVFGYCGSNGEYNEVWKALLLCSAGISLRRHYPGQSEMIADYWMPNRNREGCDVTDPSARVLSNYGQSGT